MAKIFVHALEGEPEDLAEFRGKTERDIRVRWLVANPENAAVGTGPWKVKRIYPHGIVLEPSRSGEQPRYLNEVYLPYIPDGARLAERLPLLHTDPLHVDFAPTLTDPYTLGLSGTGPNRDTLVEVVEKTNPNLFYLGFYWGKAPFDNVDARKAVVCAIDVPTHADLKLKGGGAGKGRRGPSNRTDPAEHSPSWEQPLAQTGL